MIRKTITEWTNYPSNRNNRNKDISRKRKYIENSLIPELNKLDKDINLNPNAISNTLTTATYEGDFKGSPIALEFNTNNIGQDGGEDLFVNVYYQDKGIEAGAINSSDGVDYALDLINGVFHKLGLRTNQDIEDENNERMEKQKADAMKKKEEYRAQQQADMEKEKEDSEDSEQQEKDRVAENKNQLDLFDSYLSVLTKENDMNGVIQTSIYVENINSESLSYSVLGVDCFYISAKMCLVQTNKINPKVDKTSSWDSAKNYISNIADKLKGTISVVAFDSNGKAVELEGNSDSDSVNVDINL